MTSRPAPTKRAPRSIRRCSPACRGDIAVSLRILPAQDARRWNEQLWDAIDDAGAAAPALRLGDLWRGRLDPRAHPRHGRADRRARPTLPPAAHLTCVGASKDEIAEVADAILGRRRAPHRRAARRSAAEPGGRFTPHPDGYASAAELVAGLKALASVRDFGRRLSRSPPRCAERRRPTSTTSSARSMPGASRAITQFFFRADAFFRFRDAAAAAGIDAPRSCRASCR